MAVQLHYDGSAFDLDPEHTDAFWVEYVNERIAAIQAGVADGVGGIYVTLDGDREALIPYAPGDRIVLVADRGTNDRDLTVALTAFDDSDR